MYFIQCTLRLTLQKIVLKMYYTVYITIGFVEIEQLRNFTIMVVPHSTPFLNIISINIYQLEL